MATTKEIWKYDKSLLTFERSLVTEAQGAKMVAVINIQRRADKIVQSKALAAPPKAAESCHVKIQRISISCMNLTAKLARLNPKVNPHLNINPNKQINKQI